MALSQISLKSRGQETMISQLPTIHFGVVAWYFYVLFRQPFSKQLHNKFAVNFKLDVNGTFYFLLYLAGSVLLIDSFVNSEKLHSLRFPREKVRNLARFLSLEQIPIWCSSAGRCTIIVWVESSKIPCDIPQG